MQTNPVVVSRQHKDTSEDVVTVMVVWVPASGHTSVDTRHQRCTWTQVFLSGGQQSTLSTQQSATITNTGQ